MTNTIRTPLIRMSVIFGTLIILSIWQMDFIVTAVSANVMLNLSIFAVFFFGVFLTYRNVLRLQNEDHAFRALQELQADAQVEERGKLTDPLWRHYRCEEMATVFKKPEVLGPAYQLISEELSRNKHISVDPTTMQTILDAINARLFERKSLTQYIAGILVLLGLIGTFLGLMITLASVGSILAAIDLTGSDPSGAIQNLMNKLQEPLVGMATGFSSSLFGLVTSLSLGLMVRFSGMAFAEFVQDIEGWLSTIVEIDSDQGVAGATSDQKTALMEERRLSLIMRTARLNVVSNAKLNEKLDKLTGAVDALSTDAKSQRLALDDLVATGRQLHVQGEHINTTMARTVDTVRLIASNNDMKNEMIETTNALSKHLEIRDDHMSNHLKTLDLQLTQFNTENASKSSEKLQRENEDAYALLEEIKASLKDGDMATLRANLKDRGVDAAETPTRDDRIPNPATNVK